MDSVIKKLPGISLAAIIAVPAWVLGQQFPVIGSPVLGILFGMLLAFWKRPPAFQSGVTYTSKKLLQYSIILLGFDMNLFQIFQAGSQTLLLMAFTLTATFLGAYLVGKALKVDRDTNILVGVGTAICGGSAIAATAPVIGAKDEDVARSISTIFLFNVIAAFLFPFLGHTMQMSDFHFGLWAGTAINDTSSVVAGLHLQRRGRQSGGYCQADAHADDHPRHAGARFLHGKAAVPHGQRQLQLCKDFSVVCSGLCRGGGHQHLSSPPGGNGKVPRLLRQICDRHGNGGNRPEHQSDRSGQTRLAAGGARLLLLGDFGGHFSCRAVRSARQPVLICSHEKEVPLFLSLFYGEKADLTVCTLQIQREPLSIDDLRADINRLAGFEIGRALYQKKRVVLADIQ